MNHYGVTKQFIKYCFEAEIDTEMGGGGWKG